MKKRFIKVMSAIFGIGIAASSVPLIMNSVKISDTQIQESVLEEKITDFLNRPEKIIKVKISNDLKNNKYFFVLTENNGIFVFNEDKFLIEYLPEIGEKIDLNENIFYLGSNNYFYKRNDKFYHWSNNQEVDYLIVKENQPALDNLQKKIKIKLQEDKEKTLNDGISLYKYDSESKWYGGERLINGYEHILEATFPDNDDSSCGFITACLVLYWWHKMNDKPIIDERFLNSDGKLKDTGYTLKHELQDIMRKEKGWQSWWSTSDVMNTVIYEYAKKYQLNISTWSFPFNHLVWTEIDNGYPVMAFLDIHWTATRENGKYKHEKQGPGCWHVVPIYGYNKDYYICNMGWDNYKNQKVYLTSIAFGSNLQLRVN